MLLFPPYYAISVVIDRRSPNDDSALAVDDLPPVDDVLLRQPFIRQYKPPIFAFRFNPSSIKQKFRAKAFLSDRTCLFRQNELSRRKDVTFTQIPRTEIESGVRVSLRCSKFVGKRKDNAFSPVQRTQIHLFGILFFAVNLNGKDALRSAEIEKSVAGKYLVSAFLFGNVYGGVCLPHLVKRGINKPVCGNEAVHAKISVVRIIAEIPAVTHSSFPVLFVYNGMATPLPDRRKDCDVCKSDSNTIQRRRSYYPWHAYIRTVPKAWEISFSEIP